MKTSMDGWGSGLLGVIIFSGSLPATRVAVGGFSPLFLTSARAVIAALLAAVLLVIWRQARPVRRDMVSLAIVALGVVVGFPLLTALALQTITSAHSVVFVGLLPLMTAIFAVLRGGERPKPLFWLFSCLGSAIVAGFALVTGEAASSMGDLLMIAAIVLCGLGYAEGARLSRRLGGWQVISWALLLSLPVMVVLALLTLPVSWQAVTMPHGSASLMSRCSACWSVLSSGIAVWLSEGWLRLASYNCCSHFSAWPLPQRCCMSR